MCRCRCRHTYVCCVNVPLYEHKYLFIYLFKVWQWSKFKLINEYLNMCAVFNSWNWSFQELMNNFTISVQYNIYVRAYLLWNDIHMYYTYMMILLFWNLHGNMLILPSSFLNAFQFGKRFTIYLFVDILVNLVRTERLIIVQVVRRQVTVQVSIVGSDWSPLRQILAVMRQEQSDEGIRRRMLRRVISGFEKSIRRTGSVHAFRHSLRDALAVGHREDKRSLLGVRFVFRFICRTRVLVKW